MSCTRWIYGNIHLLLPSLSRSSLSQLLVRHAGLQLFVKHLPRPYYSIEVPYYRGADASPAEDGSMNGHDGFPQGRS
jgi:hypothetical protein